VTGTAAGADVLVRQLGLVDDIVDVATLSRAVDRFRSHGITLPTFAELADPRRIDPARTAAVDPGAPHPGNLFRVHWHNDGSGRRVDVPDHLVVPRALTGVDAPIVVVFGDRFPMIGAHKVLAAYACLAPRVVSGQFDPTRHRAVWPSTGNYARGGVAISRIMGCRGVAVLPAGMSQERFDWLDRWVADPGDIIRTAGSESNVKEIYDACHELVREPANIVFNQFSELANHLAHVAVTAPALARVFDRLREGTQWRLAAFVSATGSAGTIAAGDVLKERYGSRIVAVEALECPTMLENGFGEHNIQGIGDKHIPLIHNVMNTDVICAISDESTDELDVLFNTEAGRTYLAKRRGLDDDTLGALRHLGLSSICNVLAAIKTARLLGLGADDAIVTVATDGGAMYASERVKTLADRWPDGFGELEAAEVFGRHLGHVDSRAMIECTERDRNRIFNLGYYTWVEQQGTPIDVFEARRAPSFWTGLRRYVDVWDALIDDFNGRVAAGS
jgi:cysteine synthase